MQALCAKWCSIFSQDDAKVWSAMYAPNAVLPDHAMHTNLEGLANVEDHFKIW